MSEQLTISIMNKEDNVCTKLESLKFAGLNGEHIVIDLCRDIVCKMCGHLCGLPRLHVAFAVCRSLARSHDSFSHEKILLHQLEMSLILEDSTILFLTDHTEAAENVFEVF